MMLRTIGEYPFNNYGQVPEFKKNILLKLKIFKQRNDYFF